MTDIGTNEASDVVLCEEGPDKKKLRITLHEYKGTPLLQLRYFYVDKKSGETKPTKNGIAITRNRYLDLVETIDRNRESIADYLAGDVIEGTALTSLSQLKAQTAERACSISKISVKKQPGRLAELFETSFQGGTAELAINSNHEFLDEIDPTDSATDLTLRALVALDLASELIKHNEAYQVQHAIDRLQDEFRRQLRLVQNATIKRD